MVLTRTRTGRWLLAVAFVIVLAIGILIGGHPSWLPSSLRSVFVSQTSQERQVQAVLNLIAQNYYRPINTQRLLDNGLQSAVSGLDPYSHYFPPALYRSFQYQTNPQVTGIGVDVNPEPVDGGIQIEEVFPGSPAAKSDLAHGDIIVAVDGTSLRGKSVDEGSKLIRGDAGTTVVLTVRRGGKTHRVRIVRQTVTVPVAASQMLHYDGHRLGYLQFTQFTEGSAGQLRAQARHMLHDHATGLILDLRENPGGLLAEAVAAASIFIEDGTVVTTRGRNQPTHVYVAQGNAIAPRIPMVVLVDHGTASSAEILTAALQDRGRAKVVGTHTYGKGVFQEIQPLANGGALDITVGEYFTPNGRNLGGGGTRRGAGVTPNVYAGADAADPGRGLRVAERVLASEISRK
jgi:carboxyl-terminal processing protease